MATKLSFLFGSSAAYNCVSLQVHFLVTSRRKRPGVGPGLVFNFRGSGSFRKNE